MYEDRDDSRFYDNISKLVDIMMMCGIILIPEVRRRSTVRGSSLSG